MTRRTIYTSHNNDTITIDHAQSDRRYITLTVIGTDHRGTSVLIPAGDVDEFAKRLKRSVADVLPPHGTFEEEP